MNDLIKDEGVLRKCPSNIAKMGYWASYKAFFSYKDALDLPYSEWITAIGLGIVAVMAFAITPFIAPFAPHVQCFFQWRKAVRDVKEEESNK